MSRAVATAVLGAALVAAAILFGLASLYVPGIALLLLAAAAAIWTAFAARGARVELAVDRVRVEEGDLLTVTALVDLPRWSAPAELAVGGLDAPAVVVRGRRDLRFEAPAGRRGRRTVGPPRLTLRDPLGLAERVVTGRAGEVLVLPRVEPVRALGSEGAEQSAPTPAGGADGPELELDSLRPHRAGAPAARIHWPTVARSGELVERRLVADPESDPLVVVDAAAPVGEEALDRVLRAAASLCLALGRAGGCRVLLPGDRRPMRLGRDLRAWPALHARLALVERAPVSARISFAGRSGGLFLLTAAASEAPRALPRVPAGDRWLVTPLRPTAGDAAFRVAGCTGFKLARTGAKAA